MRRPAITIAIAVALSGAGAFGVARSHVDPSPETYAHGTEVWDAYAKVDDAYEIGETVVIAFRELGGTVFDVETVGAVATFDRALNTMPSVQRVLSIASATALDRDNEILDLTPLLPSGPITKETAIKLATRIRRHPVYGRALVDVPHETTFVFVQLSLSVKDPLKRIEATRDIRALADTFRSKHRTVHLAGSTLTKEAVASSLQRDTLIFFPIVVLLLVLLLWIIYGELVAALVPLAAIGVSTVTVIGLVVAFGVRLNLTTAAVPIIVIVVGLAESVHFLSELRRQHTRTSDRDVSLIAAVEAVSVPCLVTTAAAAIGFLSLAPSLIAPLEELGLTAALGLLLVYACTMLLSPALLRVFKFPRRRTQPFASAAWVGKVFSRLAIAEKRAMIVVIAAVGLLSGVAVAGLSAIRIDSSYVGYLDEEHRLRQDIAIIERTLGGAETLELIIDGPGEGFFKRIPSLAKLDGLKKTMESSDAIHTAFSVADYLKIANAVMTGGRDAEDRLPESEEAVAQLTVIDPTPFSAFTNEEMQQARMALQVRTMTNEGVLHLAAQVKQAADEQLAGTGVKTHVTGLPIVYANLTRYVVEDTARRFVIGAFFVWIVLMIGLRSVAIPTVAMLPTTLTAVFTLATMAVANIALDTNLILVGSLVLCIAVNHAVHLAERYQRAREEGSPSPGAAVLYAATHGGHPIAITSLLLAIGFLVLCLSSFGPTLQMGVLGAMVAAYALAFELCLLPVLLMTADWLENRHSATYDVDSAKVQKFRRVSSMLTSARPTPNGTGRGNDAPPGA